MSELTSYTVITHLIMELRREFKILRISESEKNVEVT